MYTRAFFIALFLSLSAVAHPTTDGDPIPRLQELEAFFKVTPPPSQGLITRVATLERKARLASGAGQGLSVRLDRLEKSAKK